jgi:hypothetical protein
MGLPAPAQPFHAQFCLAVVELVLLNQPVMSVDIVIGRTLACCLHPAAAWRRVSASGRALIVGTYFAASYLAVLAVLMAR